MRQRFVAADDPAPDEVQLPEAGALDVIIGTGTDSRSC
jgi:hypothetical protein